MSNFLIESPGRQSDSMKSSEVSKKKSFFIFCFFISCYFLRSMNFHRNIQIILMRRFTQRLTLENGTTYFLYENHNYCDSIYTNSVFSITVLAFLNVAALVTGAAMAVPKISLFFCMFIKSSVVPAIIWKQNADWSFIKKGLFAVHRHPPHI